jgi:hypothetical protein
MASQLTSLASQQLDHPFRHDPLESKKMEDQSPQVPSHFTVKKEMICGLSLFLHLKHQSITLTYLFLRLSKVKMVPNAIVYTKNDTLEWALFLQMLFQRNEEHKIKGFDL